MTQYFSGVMIFGGRLIRHEEYGDVYELQGGVENHDKKSKVMKWLTEPIDGTLYGEDFTDILYIEWHESSSGKAIADRLIDKDSADDALAAYILGRGSHENAILVAAKNNWIKTIQVLIDVGTDFSITDGEGSNAVSIAVRRNNPRLVKLLAPLCDVNAVCRQDDTTPIIHAILHDDLDMARDLIAAGARLDIDAGDQTPLMMATRGSLAMVDLIASLADPRYVSIFRETAESVARKRGEVVIADYLKELCASLDFRDEMQRDIPTTLKLETREPLEKIVKQDKSGAQGLNNGKAIT
jgi:ankyrin repeat protein